MSDIKVVIHTEERVDLRLRLCEIMADLGYPSSNAAANAAGLDPTHLRRLTLTGEPNVRTLRQIAGGWGVPVAAFFISRASAAPLVSDAPHFTRKKRTRKNSVQKVV